MAFSISTIPFAQDRPLFPVFLGDVNSTPWLGPILAILEPLLIGRTSICLEEPALETLMPLARHFQILFELGFVVETVQERVRGDIGIGKKAGFDAAP